MGCKIRPEPERLDWHFATFQFPRVARTDLWLLSAGAMFVGRWSVSPTWQLSKRRGSPFSNFPKQKSMQVSSSENGCRSPMAQFSIQQHQRVAWGRLLRQAHDGGPALQHGGGLERGRTRASGDSAGLGNSKFGSPKRERRHTIWWFCIWIPLLKPLTERHSQPSSCGRPHDSLHGRF